MLARTARRVLAPALDSLAKHGGTLGLLADEVSPKTAKALKRLGVRVVDVEANPLDAQDVPELEGYAPIYYQEDFTLDAPAAFVHMVATW